ncbi:universal stress protein [Bifidobacterium sp. 82T24]|uniref:universal stress protein n=1 Tax=Bifidobacterium pluvialisilvae TaxID=2834436 RepID=UPI001C58E7FD|nr:universal stress protein [Bifidobacterium pluvialisilvae]MBW3087164.1 universal stress protein [Bifidobacterium pluvialisilvae]
MTAEHVQTGGNANPTDVDGDRPLRDIVVGVDGSTESFAALKWALNEAGRTGQNVNAVFGWTHSWDIDAEPDSDEAWRQVRNEIRETLRSWVDEASEGIDFNPENLKLTSVKASGSAALLQIGSHAQQIVVGRRSLGRVARWFLGSLSSSLAEEAKVPVTAVRAGEADSAESVQSDIARVLDPDTSDDGRNGHRRPIVVGIDGSKGAQRALRFAVHEAIVNRRPLHVLFCWQMRDLGKLPGFETTVPSVAEGQRHAEGVLRDTVAEACIPDDVEVHANAFHISAGKGLVSASRYAYQIVVGTRGLSGLDAHFLGSVSSQVLNDAECTVTVVH